MNVYSAIYGEVHKIAYFYAQKNPIWRAEGNAFNRFRLCNISQVMVTRPASGNATHSLHGFASSHLIPFISSFYLIPRMKRAIFLLINCDYVFVTNSSCHMTSKGICTIWQDYRLWLDYIIFYCIILYRTIIFITVASIQA